METIQVITLIAALAIAAIIINFLFYKLIREEEKEQNIKVETRNTDFLIGNPVLAPSDTPYEDLWHRARCPMRNQSSFRLAMMGLETGREDHAQREAIYKDEILHLINKSALCDKGEADSSVREFCLGQTPLNQSVEYRIKTAEIMRKYITTGKIPNKEEQLWTVCKKL